MRRTDLMNFIGMPSELDALSGAKIKNSARYDMEFGFLYNLVYDSFGIKEGTCPDTYDERTAKRSIIATNRVCQFMENELPYDLPCANAGEYTKMYRYPTKVFVYSQGGYYADVDCHIPNGSGSFVRDTLNGEYVEGKSKGVIIKAREDESATLLKLIASYAYDMSDMMRTLDVQRRYMKTPGYLSVNEEAKNAIKRINKQRDENEELIDVGIYGANALGAIPYTIPTDLHHESKNTYEWYYHQFMNRIGFNTNSSPDKAANLTEDEVNSDANLSSFNIESLVNSLNYWQKIANEAHGTNIVWEVKHKLPKAETQKESEDKENE